ncbi:MAG: TIGR03936 family radical SAM-associated protein [Candidatus Omnitrophota bacterium]
MNEAKYPIKIVIHKSGDMIYFSQLDLSRILERALRRSTLPLYYTSGFNPHVKLSFGRAVKIGIEADEEVTLYFLERITSEQLRHQLVTELPVGLTIQAIVE